MIRLHFLYIILGMTAVTYASRVGFIGIAKQFELHPLLKRSLEYVPVTILAALVFPAVLAPSGKLANPIDNPYVWAAAITVAVHLAFRRPVVSILVGAGSMVLFRQVLGV